MGNRVVWFPEARRRRSRSRSCTSATFDSGEAGAIQDDQQGGITFLVMHCRKLRCHGAIALPSETTDDFVVRACGDFLRYLGRERL
eukprot:1232977-Pyramimonas_sp.AAC.1